MCPPSPPNPYPSAFAVAHPPVYDGTQRKVLDKSSTPRFPVLLKPIGELLFDFHSDVFSYSAPPFPSVSQK